MRPEPFRFLATGNGERLDRLVADATGRGRRAVKEWLRAGRVCVDGRVATGAEVPRPGSEVTVREDGIDDAIPAAFPPTWQPVLETQHLLAVDKPAGLHCVRGRSAGSLAESLAERHGELALVSDESGLVHRLDRDTSGVVLVARDGATWRRLRRAFSQGRTRKQYLALVAGRIESAGDIDVPLARRGAKMAPATRHDDALRARTHVEPLERGADWSLVLATMSTGAMHQIRVHLASVGHPLVGDTTYGGPELRAPTRDGQLLHAFRVEVDGEVDVSVAPPADFVAAYAALQRDASALVTSSS